VLWVERFRGLEVEGVEEVEGGLERFREFEDFN
jgi:hypothetical protein